MKAAFHSINGRILLLPAVASIALVLAGFLSIRMIGDITLSEHQARARVVTESAVKIVESFEGRAARGEMPLEAAQDAAKQALRAIRYDGNEYVIARGLDGVIIVNGLFKDREGSKSIDNKDANGTFFSREMIQAAQGGGAFTYYLWPKKPDTPPLRKATYSKLTPGWKWVVGSGVYLDDVEAATRENALRAAGVIAVLALLSFAAALWLGRRITRPILDLGRATHRLADGDLSVTVPGLERRDEIGTMAQAVAVLKERSAEAARLGTEQERLKEQAAEERRAEMRTLADGFEASVKAMVDAMASSAAQMRVSADSMTAAASTASGETTAASAAAEQTSANVGTVASATEELSASIHEISRQIAQSSQIASDAVSRSERANAAIEALAESVKRVGDVVAMISGIAGQTNLLALNATIEAARAGEVGKGFAVVASEVKTLATQTAKATEEIQATVAEIQSMTGAAVSAIQGIGDSVTRIDEVTSAVSAAVVEQGAATREIAGNIQQAAEGTRQVAGNVTAAQRAVIETGNVASGVLDAAGLMSREVQRLQVEVGNFLSNVRAA
ncbi:cache domain-containing protein [Azospirillum sp. SYSU D00513]|uniref:methyl-accepting chemotaxis protein n=1 Tax=Azospirillum sp. SYSU D00513 TaxID=2812561 RepID=UPI001A964E4F|nr:cache domain-containing protein [Azospirillum sp. SYSU D00513]